MLHEKQEIKERVQPKDTSLNNIKIDIIGRYKSRAGTTRQTLRTVHNLIGKACLKDGQYEEALFFYNTETEGQTDIIFEKAKVTLGVTVGTSFQSETGVSRTFTAEPHKVLHVQYGTYIDHLYVHSYDQDERCNITNENIQFVDVVETVGTWKASEASL